MVAVALLLVTFAHAITGRPAGWIINKQNRMSLSQFQMFLWMVVVLSAFLAAALVNINTGSRGTDALTIAVPELLWLAMGISATSFVGSGLILNGKQKKEPADPPVEKLAVSRGKITPAELSASRQTDAQVTKAVSAGVTNAPRQRDAARLKVGAEVQQVKDNELNGVLLKNASPADANPAELTTGEEVGNEGVLVPTRFFNLIVTVILVGVYAVSLADLFLSVATNGCGRAAADPNTCGITSFPELGAAAATLLTLTHAAYLADKYPDKEEVET
jgi:hypothetical protein